MFNTLPGKYQIFYSSKKNIDNVLNNSKTLDQFYTKPEVAKKCLNIFNRTISNYINLEKIKYLEPSAGTGSFYNLMPKNKIGFDLDPKIKEIIKKDFFETTKNDINSECVTIGNPPFGKKSKLAIKFFNHSTNFSNTIAFIIPIQFRKWSVQSKLNKDFSLIKDITLEKDSFIFNNKSYNVNCCFQIWTKLETNYKNLRIQNKPPLEHEDFKMWQYNNTKKALKVFENEFDFAVPRQGYYDYTRKEIDKNKCEKNIQWILFKANKEEILKNLKNIDFLKLANKNTSVLGFGKADVVEEYNFLYGKK